ncbi:mitochondrial fission 1 protein A [Artemisia annua]|uniref:Mitochondrial fission 1 protein A n=1 Tax=Artemisia annua TaxID=35608 RepID=A0A2U1KVX4_ARTAN|nr:mitochondrial fission 1 protein A [Artemisia annua]
METFVDFLGSFTRDHSLPWTDAATVKQWDSEYAAAFYEKRLEIRYPYIRALVHSKRPHDVHRGKGRLSFALNYHSSDLRQKKKWMYLYAVAHFRCGEYSESANYVDKCLEIKPDDWKVLNLKKIIKERVEREEAYRKIINSATKAGAVTSVLTAIIIPQICRYKR